LRLFAIIWLGSALVCQGGGTLAGRWEGSAEIPGGELKLIIDLAQDRDQQWIGSVIVPGLGVKGAPLTDIAVKDSDISFSIKGALGSERVGQTKLTGHLKSDSRFTGEFIQGGNHAPFDLAKTGVPQVELPPHNTVVSKQVEGEWKGEYELNGYPRHVTMKFANHGEEGAGVEFVIVGKKTNNVPVTLLTQEGDFISVKSDEFRMSYEGRVQSGAGKITGTLSQGPLEVPLIMERIN
jgi:hypothetical protein